jgi:uncharacterized protein
MARLELRPNCELCGKDLPPQSSEARICTYECTYCAACADTVLHNVCINCGGNLERRPIRPLHNYQPRESTGLGHHPASDMRVMTAYSDEAIASHVARIKGIAPEKR